MENNVIKYWLPETSQDLEHATIGSAGFDVRTTIGSPREMSPLDVPEDGIIKPGERWLVGTDLYLQIPKGVCAQICSRSGLAINHGVVVLNAPGIIDSDYRGECKINLINLGRKPYVIKPGERIAQLVFVPYFPEYQLVGKYDDAHSRSFDIQRVKSRDELSDTPRGSSGFGSTGS